MVGLWVTVSLAVFSGLTMYSIYKNCDPLTNGDVKNFDQVNATGCFSTAAVSCPDVATLIWSTLSAPAAALPRYGHFGSLPWNPWLVCGCCLQRHPEVRPGTGAHVRKKVAVFLTDKIKSEEKFTDGVTRTREWTVADTQWTFAQCELFFFLNKSVTYPVLHSVVLLRCSTVSSSINALVAVTVEDFIITHFKNLSDKQLKWLNMGLSKCCHSHSTMLHSNRVIIGY